MEYFDVVLFLPRIHFFVIYIVVFIFLIKYHRQTKLLMPSIIALVIMALAKFFNTTVRAFEDYLYQQQYLLGNYDYGRLMVLVDRIDGLAHFVIFVLLFWQIFKLAKKIGRSQDSIARIQ